MAGNGVRRAFSARKTAILTLNGGVSVFSGEHGTQDSFAMETPRAWFWTRRPAQ
jgi:hypothetical protein